MKRTSKMLFALLLAFLTLTLGSCGYDDPSPEVYTVEELVGYVNLYLKYPMKHSKMSETEKSDNNKDMAALILSCKRAVAESNSASSIIGMNFELASSDGCAKSVLSAILEFITDNLDNCKTITNTNFPETDSDILSKVAIWEYWSSEGEMLSIIVVQDCNCGCNGELWLLCPGETSALMKVSVS